MAEEERTIVLRVKNIKNMRIGITGTIGSGKSEVSSYLRSKGYNVFDCDAYNKELLDNNAYELLHNDFEDCFIGNTFLKSELINVIFNDKLRKLKLESIMHPLILKKMFSVDDDPLFAEVPLLYEAHWDFYFDQVLLVICDEKIAIDRLIKKGMKIDDIKGRILSQEPKEEKIKKASRIIYNNGSLFELHKAIDNYLKSIC